MTAEAQQAVRDGQRPEEELDLPGELSQPGDDHGSFREDLDHFAEMWLGQSGQSGWYLKKLGLIWTHSSLQATALLRLAAWCSHRGVRVLPGVLRRLNIMLFGLDVVSGIPIGGGLYLPHTVGTVIMARRLGRNVTLVSNVTIGMRHRTEFPVIGNDVYIGAGARILGPVTIGDGAVIGANAVVITDVPPGATAVGVPARIIVRSEKQDEQRDT